jgi:hypothetical protein
MFKTAISSLDFHSVSSWGTDLVLYCRLFKHLPRHALLLALQFIIVFIILADPHQLSLLFLVFIHRPFFFFFFLLLLLALFHLQISALLFLRLPFVQLALVFHSLDFHKPLTRALFISPEVQILNLSQAIHVYKLNIYIFRLPCATSRRPLSM